MSLLLLEELRRRVEEPEPEPEPETPDYGDEPAATWLGSPNYTTGRGGHTVVGIVVHTIVGTLAGADAWFANTASQVSAHYGVGLGGAVHQYVDLANTAWHAGGIYAGRRISLADPNRQTVGIETEDLRNEWQEVTDAQYNGTLWCCRWAIARYPSIRYIIAHRALQPTRGCPSPRWYATGRMEQLADELGLELVL